MTDNVQQSMIPMGYGIHRSPSIGNDGEFSELVGLMPKSGELVNIQPPKYVEHVPLVNGAPSEYYTIKAVHDIPNGNKHKIYLYNKNRYENVQNEVYDVKVKSEVVETPDVLENELRLKVSILENPYPVACTLKVILKNGDNIFLSYTPGNNTIYKQLTNTSWSYTNQVYDIVSSIDETLVDIEDDDKTVYIVTSNVISGYNENDDPDLPISKKSKEISTSYNRLVWCVNDTDTPTLICSDSVEDTIKEVTCIGNTLVVMFEKHMEYFIWRGTEYVSLGNSIPEIDVKLGLSGNLRMQDGVSRINLVKAAKQGYAYNTTVASCIDSLDGGNVAYISYGTTPFSMNYYNNSGTLSLTKNTPYRVQNNSNCDIYIYFCVKNSSHEYYSVNVTRYKIKKSSYADISLTKDCNEIVYTTTKMYRSTSAISFNIKQGESVEAQAVAEVERTEENFNALKAVANEFIADSSSRGRFTMPFYARVGLRLYDGTISKLSVPILLIPNTGSVPNIIIPTTPKIPTNTTDKALENSMSAIAVESSLQYKISKPSIDRLSDWTDIITGLTISVTPPIYEYCQSKTYSDNDKPLAITEFSMVTNRQKSGQPIGHDFGYSYGSIIYTDRENTEVTTDHKKIYVNDVIGETDYIPFSETTTVTLAAIELPTHTEEEIRKNYTEMSSFNVLKDIDVSELVENTWTTIDTDKIDISSSENWEQCPDDYSGHDSVRADISFAYNSRLHLAGITKSHWGGLNPIDMIGEAKNDDGSAFKFNVRAVVSITENRMQYFADSLYYGGELRDQDIFWFYYPNKNANSVTFYFKMLDDGKYYKNEQPLSKHKLLNGAYMFNNFEHIGFGEECTEEEATREISTEYISQPNMLYVSDANDPFTFSEKTTIGNGKILGLSTSAKAISQGQFGDFPLYAFCSDGIWALGVSNDGSYSSRQPVSRDVCISPSSITQLDGGVAFVTNQGLKVISGSEVSLLSGTLDGHNVNENFIKSTINDFKSGLYVEDTAQFSTQIANSRIVYDYPHNMLHVFPQVTGAGPYKHYVLSLDETEWSTQVMDKDITAIVPGYPLTTIQMGTSLYTYDKIVDETARYGYALTRINYLGNPVCRKMLYDLRTIGQRLYNDSVRKVAVYVSDDKINWYPLKSLKALSAKYYRFLVMTKMRDTETVSGITAQYVERFNNKMR